MNRKRSVARVKQSRKQVQVIPPEITAQELRAGIARLAQDLHRSEKTTRPTAKIHIQVQATLPPYIAAQQQGQDAAILYPEIATHLRVCQVCRTHYELTLALVESLEKPKAPARVNNPAALSYPTLWRKIEFPASRTQKDKVRFVFTPKQLRGLTLQAPATRSGNELSAHLFLYDQFAFAAQSVVVQAWLYPHSLPKNTLDLEVILEAPQRLVKELRVSLFSGKHKIQGQTKRGKTIFNITRAAFSKRVTLSIERITQDGANALPKPRPKKA